MLRFIPIKSSRSHGGCETCKKRKKKCDQQKPCCGWCAKRHTPCVYKKFVFARHSNTSGSFDVTNSSSLNEFKSGDNATASQKTGNLVATSSKCENNDNKPKRKKRKISSGKKFNKSVQDWKLENVGMSPLKRKADMAKTGESSTDISKQDTEISRDQNSQATFNLDNIHSGGFSFEADFFKGSLNAGADDNFIDIKNIIESILHPSPRKHVNTPPDSTSIELGKIDGQPGNGTFERTFHKNLQELSLLVGRDNKNEHFDMDLSARSFLMNFRYFASDSDKYNRSFDLFLPLAYQNEAVFYAVSGWGLLVLKNGNQKAKALDFLKKSKKLCNDMQKYIEEELPNLDRYNLISLVVGLSCLMFAASSVGDITRWKENFEDLYHTLHKVGLETFFENVKDSPVGLWVLNCFFYNDVLKVVRVTDDQKVGTLFPLSKYKKIINFNFEKMDHTLEADDFEVQDDLNSGEMIDIIDPLMGCCIGLFFRMGEINTLYDQFVIKINALDDTWIALSHEMEDIKGLNLLEFTKSQRYRRYEDMRLIFHDWVKVHTDRLVLRLHNTMPRIIALRTIREPERREYYLTFFRVLQIAMELFLEIKLKESPLKALNVKRLMVHCYRDMRQLIIPDFVRKLTFPLLVVGAAACEKRDRIIIEVMYLEMYKIWKNENLAKIWSIIQEFWKLNPNGDTFDRSQNIINKLDWNICLV